MTRKHDGLSPYFDQERSSEEVRVRAGAQYIGGVGYGGMETAPFVRATEDELVDRAQRAKAARETFLASPAHSLLEALSEIQSAAEDARGAYSRGFDYGDNLDKAVAHVSRIITGAQQALAALNQIAEEKGR